MPGAKYDICTAYGFCLDNRNKKLYEHSLSANATDKNRQLGGAHSLTDAIS